MGRLYVMILLVSAMVAAGLGHGRLAGSRAPAPGPDANAVALVDSAESAGASRSMQAMTDDGSIELERNADGHFYADVDINGADVHMLVDTGASGVALSREDAARVGVAQSIGMNEVIGSGAEGDVHGEYVMLDRVELGAKSVEHVPAVILGSGPQSLLGQAFLRQFGSVEISGDKMRLQ